MLGCGPSLRVYAFGCEGVSLGGVMRNVREYDTMAVKYVERVYGHAFRVVALAREDNTSQTSGDGVGDVW